MVVARKNPGGGLTVGYFENSVQAIGRGFIGTKNTEIVERIIQFQDVAQHLAQHARRFRDFPARFGNRDRVGAEVGQMQVA